MKSINRRLSRIICFFVIACMLIEYMPGMAFAESEGYSINASKITLTVDQTYKLQLTGDTIGKVSSSDRSVAAASGTGLVRAKKAGTSVVTITGSSGRKYNCTVKVRNGLFRKTVYVTKGRSVKLKLHGTKVKSAKSLGKGTASIVRKGSRAISVKGVKKGSTRIRIKGKDNKNYQCKIVVETPSLSKKKLTLAKGDSFDLSLRNTEQSVEWKSSAARRATVSSEGVIKAVSGGKVRIKAVDGSGAAYICNLTVEEPEISVSEMHMDVNDTANLNLAGNTQKVTWESSVPGIASVNERGDVRALADGKTVITATVSSGASYRCDITVGKEKTDESGDDTGNGGSDGDNSGGGASPGGGGSSGGASPGGGGSSGGGTTPGGGGSSGGGTSPDPGEGSGEVLNETVCINFVDKDGGSKLKPVYPATAVSVGDLEKPAYTNGRMFLGWYYDDGLTEPASDSDVIRTSKTLYAKSLAIEENKTPDDAARITAEKDAPQDFTIVIKSKNTGMSADDVMGAISFNNITHKDSEVYQEKDNNIRISGSNGTYTLSGRHLIMTNKAPEAGFEEGASYTISLPEPDSNGNSELTFEGEADSVREFDLTIARREKNNLALADDVVMVNLLAEAKDLRSLDNEAMEYIDGSLMAIDASGTQTESDEMTGSFMLKQGISKEIKAGSTVALYSGMDPSEALKDPEAFENGDNHIAYVFINKVESGRYYFCNAEISDIMKQPEILPVPADADLKLDNKESTYELPLSVLDWSDDSYKSAGLDSQTSLDEGDYIALYRGKYGSNEVRLVGDYQETLKISDVKTAKNSLGEDIEYVTVNVRAVSFDQIADSGETYYTRPIDINSEISRKERKEMEASIEESALESGFVEEAGEYLAKSALATDNFRSLSGNSIDVSDLNVTVTSRNVGSQASGLLNKYLDYSDKYKEIMDSYKQFADDDDDDDGSVEVKLTEINADIGGANHLTGGTAINLGVKFEIEVTVPKLEHDFTEGDDDKDKDGDNKDKDGDNKDKDGDKKDDDKEDDEAEEENKLNIEVSATFTQEIHLGMEFGGTVEWTEVAGFLPVPTDVIFSPGFTTGTYTGINIDSMIYTAGQDDGMGDSIFEDYQAPYKDISEELKNLMEENEEEEEDDAGDLATFLSVKYKEMLEQEHDAITLVELKLFEAKYEAVPGIISLGVELKFQVTVDIVVSLGIEFTNIQEKKTVYNIHVLKGGVDSETIELIPAELDFKFYVMGTLEIKIGFEIEFSLELLEGVLGKASLTVGVGAYVDMSGFFYYHVNIFRGDKITNYAGAIVVELGIYLEIGTGAQLGKNYKKVKGKIASFEHTLFEKQFPLKEAGENEVPLDFSIDQKDIQPVRMRQYVTEFVIPDECYELTTLSLDEGEIGNTSYEDECYGVELSNNNFSYDEENHKLILNSNFSGEKAECDMTLYYKNGTIPLSHAMIYRKYHISWDNDLDGYAITPYTQGGSYVEASVGARGSAVTAPKDPTRKGYVFDGWYTEAQGGQRYQYPETMPNTNQEIYAHWKPADDTPYAVYYYTEDPNSEGKYLYEGRKIYRGTTGTEASPAPKQIEGYVTPATEKVEILADGSAVIRYYYDIKRSTSRFTRGSHGNSADIVRVNKLSEKIYAPEMVANGYELTGWKNTETGKFISVETIVENKGVLTVADGTDAIYEAQWKVRDDILYRVEYYLQQPSGAYTVQAIDYGQGKAGDPITETAVRNNVLTVKKTEEDGTETEQRGSADNLFSYTENDVKLISFDCITEDGEKKSEDEPALIRADGSTVVKVRYSRKQCKVTLRKSDEENDDSSAYTDYTILYGAKFAMPELTRKGYVFRGFRDENGNPVQTDDTTGFAVISVKGDAVYTSMGWSANSYKVKYDAKGGTLAGNSEQIFVYDIPQKLQVAPHKDGFIFGGWKDAASGRIYEAGEEVRNLNALKNAVVNLAAVWNTESYSVSYDLDGGILTEGSNPDKYSAEDPEQVLLYPVRAGYDFDGWYAGNSRIVSLPGGKTGNLSLKAHWTARSDTKYIVKHLLQDIGDSSTGTEAETYQMISQTEGKAVSGTNISPDTGKYEGFTAPEKQTVPVEGDGSTVIEYRYSRNKHSVEIDLDGGHFTNSEETEFSRYYGEELDLGTPVKDGSIFAGWRKLAEGAETEFTASAMPDENISLKAVWTDNTAACEVRHWLMDLNGEYTILADKSIVTGNDGDTVNIEAGEYEGFTYDGKSGADGVSVTLIKDKTVTVDLHYERNKHSVKWELNGGTASNNYTKGAVYYGQTIVAPVLSKRYSSYTWDKAPEAVMGDSDLTYSAIWTADTCRVAFDPAGGVLAEGAEAEITVECGSIYGSLPEASKANAKFTGWYDAKEGGNRITANTAVTASGNHILYAGWRVVSADISYKGLKEGDVNNNPDKYAIGEETVIGPASREGYTFTGWTDGSDAAPSLVYVIGEDSKDDIVLTANWRIDKYKLQLYNSGELYRSEVFEPGTDLSNIALPERSGYRLTGWKDINTEDVIDELPETMPAGNLILSAQWEKNTYKIEFRNMYDASADDITWQIEDDDFLVPPPTKNRTGYDFAGWYRTASFAEGDIVKSMTPAAYNVELYAKWIPRTYKINLQYEGGKDSGGADSCETDNVFTYDTSKAIKTVSSLGLKRRGYVFKGWSLTSGGSVEYADGASFGEGNNLSTGDDIVNLFAVWEAVTYQISYTDITIGAASNNSKNPTSYKTTDSDIVPRNPSGIKAGYEFLGWYDSKGEKVSNLKLKGEEGDIQLKARWAHAGNFTLSLQSSGGDSPTGNGTSTFRITRTVPAGTVPSKDPQRIYFRTVNGTAVGGTASAINFYHVGGENTYALFSDTECYSMVDNKKKNGSFGTGGNSYTEFTVTQENVNTRYYGKETPSDDNGIYAQMFNLSGYSTRYYTVELYKIVSTTGYVTGVLNNTEVTRTMTIPSGNRLTTSIYDTKKATVEMPDKTEQIDDKYDNDDELSHIWFNEDTDSGHIYDLCNLNDKGITPSGNILGYLKSSEASAELGAHYESERQHGHGNSDFSLTYYLNGSKLYEIKVNSDDGVDRKWRKWDSTSVTWKNLMNGNITFSGWTGEDVWEFYNTEFELKINDSGGPKQVGIAPAATTSYKKGDKVRFSVIYNELIKSTSNIGVNTSAFSQYMPINNVTFKGGTGTNVLVFEGTATKDFENTTWGGTGTNNELIGVKPVTGTVKDMNDK